MLSYNAFPDCDSGSLILPNGVVSTDSEDSAADGLSIVGSPEIDRFVLHAACCRRIYHCFRASGWSSLARSKMTSMSASVIHSCRSQFTM